jgi:hypothetical protein
VDGGAVVKPPDQPWHLKAANMAVVISHWAPQAIATFTMPRAGRMDPAEAFATASSSMADFIEAIRSQYAGRGVALAWGVEIGRSWNPHVNVAIRRLIESRSVRRGHRTERHAALGWPDTDPGLPFRVGTVRRLSREAGFGWCAMEPVRHHLFGPAYLLKMLLFGATAPEDRRYVLDELYLALNGGVVFHGELPEGPTLGARSEADRDLVLDWIAGKDPQEYLPLAIVAHLWPGLARVRP